MKVTYPRNDVIISKVTRRVGPDDPIIEVSNKYNELLDEEKQYVLDTMQKWIIEQQHILEKYWNRKGDNHEN